MKTRSLALIGCLILCMLSACSDTSPNTEEAPSTAEIKDTVVQKGFDAMSSDYYQAETRVIWQKPDLVLNLLGDLGGKTVADIGAGTGYFAFRIASIGGNVIAIDIDERAISWMESEKQRYPDEVQARFQSRLASESDPRLKGGEVDLIMMVNTYMYIANREQYMRDLVPALKPGGQIIIVDFKKIETPIGPNSADRIAATQVQQELTHAGYTISSSDDTSLEYQYIITASRPQ